jgi:antitoxin (DNA-binding transcriptional repressor) of toxin-antitoxin stability system
MKTLTITDAKKNLGHWLKAAAQGEEVAIIAGSDIIALRKVEVAVVDTSYAEAEYGATPQSLARLETEVAARYGRQRKAGKLRSLAQVEAALEKANAH